MKFFSFASLVAIAFLSVSSIFPSASYSADAKTFTVLTRGTTKPIAYFDDNDTLTGFDIEVLREIEKRNPTIHFEYKTMSLSAAFVALDSKQGDLIAHQMTKNPQREEKYIFSSTPNNYTNTRLAVRENNTDINTINDLEGKTIITTATSETTRFLQQYAKDNNLNIKMLYTDKGGDEGLNAVTTGRADATPSYSFVTIASRKELGFKVKLVGPVIQSDPTYFILRKSPETAELAKVIDATVEKMYADGTLKALSEKFFEADYTVPQK